MFFGSVKWRRVFCVFCCFFVFTVFLLQCRPFLLFSVFCCIYDMKRGQRRSLGGRQPSKHLDKVLKHFERATIPEDCTDKERESAELTRVCKHCGGQRKQASKNGVGTADSRQTAFADYFHVTSRHWFSLSFLLFFSFFFFFFSSYFSPHHWQKTSGDLWRAVNHF